MDEEWVYIILASKVFNTFCHFKLEAKIILDVGGHHSRPNVTIIFSIHVVHLSQISIFIRNRREFKDNVLVKAWWKILHFLNFCNVVVQTFQLICGMWGVRKKLEIINDIRNQRGDWIWHMYDVWMRRLGTWRIRANGCKRKRCNRSMEWKGTPSKWIKQLNNWYFLDWWKKVCAW